MEPTKTQIRDAAHAVLYEVALFIGLYARLFRGETPTDWVALNACLEAWLLHARNLTAFFETSQEHRCKDDVVSEDYGFAAQPLPINDTVRNRFNKDLAHLTFDRIARTRQTPESRQAKKWHLLEFLPLLERCDTFVQQMQRDFRADPNDAYLLAECAKTSSLLVQLTELSPEESTG